MRTRNPLKLVLLVTLLSCSVPAAAQSRFYYDGGQAATYARNNAWMAYGWASNQNPFTGFQNNCANFVSQAIVAGMIKKTNPWDVYNRRYDFAADRSAPLSTPRWFFISMNDRGPAWQGAKEMHQYAGYNKSTYKGLHFAFVASDTPWNRSLDHNKLRPGDVIFCDWEHDGTVDHVLMVARIDTSWFILNRYNRIKIAGQSNNHSDTALQYILDKNYQDIKKWASFRVYRPVDYSQTGL